MRILSLIPARGGSRGVPRKNVRPLAGRPLLAWSIEAAQSAARAQFAADGAESWRIVVSTEDETIATVAREWGAEVIARPAELATDEAATDPVIVHAVETLKAQGWRPDLVVLLQPTVPLRAPGLVGDCVGHLLQTGADALLTVEAPHHHFVWWEEEDYVEKVVGGNPPQRWVTQCPRRPRRQDMGGRERMFLENGSVFVTRTALLEATGSRLGIVMEAGRPEYRGKIVCFETGPAIDIDTESDFAIAEAAMRQALEGVPA